MVNSFGIPTDDDAICIQREFYFFLPSQYIFCFPCLSYCISLDFYFNVERQWCQETSLPCSRSYWESFHFLTTKYDASSRFFEDVLCQAGKLVVCWVFIINKCWILSSASPPSIGMIVWFFFFSLLMDYTNWFLIVEPTFHI